MFLHAEVESHSPRGRPLSQSESGGGRAPVPSEGRARCSCPADSAPTSRGQSWSHSARLWPPHIPPRFPQCLSSGAPPLPIPIPHGSPNNRILRKPCPFWKLPLVLVVGFPSGPTARQGCALLPWSSGLQGEASVLSARGSLAQPVLKQTSAEHVRTETEKDASLLQPC